MIAGMVLNRLRRLGLEKPCVRDVRMYNFLEFRVGWNVF